MSLQEENSLIINNLLNKTFFAGWKELDNPLYENYRNLEILINGKCDLACKYCLPAGTMILLKDLTWKPIEEIRENDSVIGVEKVKIGKNSSWKYKSTIVQKIMSREDIVYEIETENGKILATSQHPFLKKNAQTTNKITYDWACIDESIFGFSKLKPGVEIRKPFDKCDEFQETEEYKRGWLLGIINGDGCVTEKKYYNKLYYRNGYNKKYYKNPITRFVRLSSIDIEIIERFCRYLDDFNYRHSDIKIFSEATKTRKLCYKSEIIRKDDIYNILNYESDSDDFKKGWLAGIFDAEGSYSCNSLRISNNNENIIQKTTNYLSYFNIDNCIERYKNSCNGIKIKKFNNVIKFFGLTNPVLQRKKKIDGLNSIRSTKVINIKKLGIQRVYNFETDAKSYIADGFIVHNCYITRFGSKLYPENIHSDDNVILNNTKMLLDWLLKNEYKPRMEIFSGETLMQNVGYDVLNMVIDFCSTYKGSITIPTNMNFVMNNNFLEKFIKAEEKAKALGVGVHLSASVDGLYCDKNRPFREKGLQRDYDKIFSFASKYKVPFHPMIYSKEIECWKDNFLWFQEMFEKYDIPWYSLYLLEIRNSEWSISQIKEFEKFISFVVSWTRKKLENLNDYDFLKCVLQNKIFNMFNLLYAIGRGTGCSIQSTMQLRLADLSVFACHRLAYDYFRLYKFAHNDEEITGIEGINPELAVAVQAMSHKSFPYCQLCMVKELCGGQCLGSMYENTGDMFTPIPTICLLEHAKIKSIINTLYELGVFPKNISLANEGKRFSIPLIHKMSKEISYDNK